MRYSIEYHYLIKREDLPALDSVWRKKIKRAIEVKLTVSPEIYGKPLRQSLKSYRKLRIGDYRVVFRIEGDTVKVIMIAHRKDIYKYIARRMKG